MRLSDEALAALFQSAESERLERKQSVSNPDAICQAICAFANDLPGNGEPGIVLIGQSDDLTCAGLTIDSRLLETVGSWRSTGKFQPFPMMSVERRVIEGCSLAVITVAPSDNTPVRYEERVWIRVDPRRATASPEEERRLIEKRRSGNLPFDARGTIEATMQDLDVLRFKLEYLPAAVPADVLAENGRSEEQQLRALRLTDQEGRPTATALLILGKRPQTFLPCAYIQALRIEGSELTNRMLDHHEITGTVGDQIRRIDELADLWTQTPSTVGGDIRRERPDYPIAALRQLFRNAVMHRTYEHTNAPVRVTWYSDRVEIQNPGGLFGQVTSETLGHPGITDYRNPTLAEALKNLGFVERFGVGLQIVDRELRLNGNAPAEFVTPGNHVLVTIRRAA